MNKMDRKIGAIGTQKEFDKQDATYWKNASIKERVQMITYLRESFYGPEATTGRVQRVYRILKHK